MSAIKHNDGQHVVQDDSGKATQTSSNKYEKTDYHVMYNIEKLKVPMSVSTFR